MATAAKQPPLAPRIRSLLRGLRWRIRLYTLVQGLALLVCWIAIMFWVVLFFDFVPVRFGATELPMVVRAGLLVFVGVGSAYILYRWVLRRTFASLADHSMAILLERKHGQFHDSLLTAVEMHEHPDHAREFNADMLEHTGAEALASAPDVRLRRVFRWMPLVWSCLAAVLLGGSLGLFAALDAHGENFEQAVDRIYLLDDRPWERLAYLEVVGITRWTIDYQPPDPDEKIDAAKDYRPRLSPVQVPFDDDKTVYVASGSNPRLAVRAEVIEHEAPGDVVLWWRTDNNRGRKPLTAEPESRDGYQYYTLTQSPLKAIDKSLRFEARGYDFRTPEHRIEVVKAPQISDVEFIYARPDYLVDEERSIFQTIRGPLIAGTQVPRGSRVTLVATANKRLIEAYVYDLATKRTELIDCLAEGEQVRVIKGQQGQPDRTEIRYVIENLTRDVALEWMLVDADGLVTETPHPMGLTVRDDKPPQVEVAVRGIGSAVTPDVRFPIAGRIADDYWIDRAWLEVQVGSNTPRQLAVPIQRGTFDEEQMALFDVKADDNVHHWIDMRDERNREENPLQLTPGDKITIATVAGDRYDLDGFDLEANPHVGVGDRYQIDVVTPDELLSILERRELEMRRRLEQIVEEITQMRDSLVRVKTDIAAISTAADAPEDEPTEDAAAEPGDKKLSPEEAARREEALRRLRVQQAVNQSEKSRGETRDVARNLLNVVDQLENNRVDTDDRQERLRDQVANPLLALVAGEFPQLDNRLAALNDSVNAPSPLDVKSATEVADNAIAQADDVLLKLDGVLQKMLDLETFNELIELVRALIDEQDELTDETKTVRKNQVFGLE